MSLERQEKKSQHLSTAPILALVLWLGGKGCSRPGKFLKNLFPSCNGMQTRLLRDFGRKKNPHKATTEKPEISAI